MQAQPNLDVRKPLLESLRVQKRRTGRAFRRNMLKSASALPVLVHELTHAFDFARAKAGMLMSGARPR